MRLRKEENMYYLKKKKKKESDKTTKKKRTPSLATYIRKLDVVFSKYIRLRDAMPSGTFKCISCGKIKSISQADCGHYWSRARMSTRFDERNCHAECKGCNRFSADHLVGYRTHLINKIGQLEYDRLQIKANETKKWSVWELEQLVKYYTLLVERIKAEKGIDI